MRDEYGQEEGEEDYGEEMDDEDVIELDDLDDEQRAMLLQHLQEEYERDPSKVNQEEIQALFEQISKKQA